MTRPPTRSTRTAHSVPYTTLFLSQLQHRCAFDPAAMAHQEPDEPCAERDRDQVHRTLHGPGALDQLPYQQHAAQRAQVDPPFPRQRPDALAQQGRIARLGVALQVALAPEEDRKSTRLNSSH